MQPLEHIRNILPFRLAAPRLRLKQNRRTRFWTRKQHWRTQSHRSETFPCWNDNGRLPMIGMLDNVQFTFTRSPFVFSLSTDPSPFAIFTGTHPFSPENVVYVSFAAAERVRGLCVSRKRRAASLKGRTLRICSRGCIRLDIVPNRGLNPS